MLKFILSHPWMLDQQIPTPLAQRIYCTSAFAPTNSLRPGGQQVQQTQDSTAFQLGCFGAVDAVELKVRSHVITPTFCGAMVPCRSDSAVPNYAVPSLSHMRTIS